MDFSHFDGQPVTFEGSGTCQDPFFIPRRIFESMSKTWGEMNTEYEAQPNEAEKAAFKEQCRKRIFKKYPQLFDNAEYTIY